MASPVIRISLLVAVLAACAADVSLAAQGLGDAARRQARKRSASGATVKTYTEADLGALRPGEETPVPTAASEPSDAASGRAPDAGLAPQSDLELREQLDREAAGRAAAEARWRSEASACRESLDAAQRDYDEACRPGLPFG